MDVLALALAALILLLMLAYARAPGVAWTVVTAAWFWGAHELLGGWPAGLEIAGVILAVLAVLLLLPPLRLALVTGDRKSVV